jgi:hypothetical protein
VFALLAFGVVWEANLALARRPAPVGVNLVFTLRGLGIRRKGEDKLRPYGANAGEHEVRPYAYGANAGEHEVRPYAHGAIAGEYKLCPYRFASTSRSYARTSPSHAPFGGTPFFVQ